MSSSWAVYTLWWARVQWFSRVQNVQIDNGLQSIGSHVMDTLKSPLARVSRNINLSSVSPFDELASYTLLTTNVQFCDFIDFWSTHQYHCSWLFERARRQRSAYAGDLKTVLFIVIEVSPVFVHCYLLFAIKFILLKEQQRHTDMYNVLQFYSRRVEPVIIVSKHENSLKVMLYIHY